MDLREIDLEELQVRQGNHELNIKKRMKQYLTRPKSTQQKKSP